MDTLNPCPCGVALCTATRHARTVQVRRGARVIEVERLFWRCDLCRDPMSNEPLELVDAVLAAVNDDAAQRVWRARFGEDLPKVQLPGRRPGKVREQRVTVLLTEDEVAQLDHLRGARSRSEFIREAVLHLRKAG